MVREKNNFVRHFVFVAFFGIALLSTTVFLSADADPKRGDEDITKGEVRRFDKFLDKHPKIGADLQKDPTLVNNKDYIKDHPELGKFLGTHPEIREELKENPTAVMKRERRYEKWGGDITRREVRNFDRYLDKHPEVSEELKKNPSLVNDKEYLAKHPGLETFLSKHPGVRGELKENPRAFMNRERRYDRYERHERAAGRGRKR